MVTGPVLVGYLDSPEGRAALAAAITETQRRSTRLLVVVAPRRGEDAQAMSVLSDQVRDQLDELNLGYEIRELEDGRDIADDLLDTAEDASAELIVIGLRRRSPVGKLILGSNAQRILLDSQVPVLAVKSAS